MMNINLRNYKWKYKRNKFLMLIVLLFFTLNIVTVFIGSVSCIIIIDHFRSLTSRYNSLTFQQTKSEIDRVTTNAEEVADDIVQNTYTSSLMSLDGITAPDNLYLSWKLIDDIRFDKNSDNIIQGIYVYFPMSNKVISDQGLYDADFFYDNIIPEKNKSYDQWKQEMLQRTRNGFETDNLYFTTYSDSVLEYYDPFNVYSDSTGACVTVILDQNMLKQELKNMNLFTSTNVVMTYEDGKTPLLEIGSSGINDYATRLNLKLGRNIVNSPQYGPLVIQQEKSLRGDWTYWVSIPEHQYYNSVDAVVKLIIFSIVLQIVIGLIMAIAFSKRSYRPVRKLADSIMRMTENAKAVNIEDDLKIIERVTSRTLSENSRYKEELERVEPILHRNFLEDLLRGSAFTKAYAEKHNYQISDMFHKNGFVVGKVFIEDCSLFIMNESISEMQLVKTAISNILSEILNQFTCTVCIDYELNAIMLIFNVAWTSDPAEVRETYRGILQAVRDAQNILVEACGIYTSVGISSMVKDVTRLNLCAAQAQEALDYKLISGLYSVNLYDDHTQGEFPYEYTMQDEEYIVNLVKAGDYSQAKALMDEIFQKNQAIFQNKSVEMGKCLMYDMVSTVLKIKNDLRIDDKRLELQVDKILKCQTLDKLRAEIYRIYAIICESVNQNKKSHNVQMKDEIIRYISEHYQDNSISLVSVAENFRLNPSYLSVFFKEQVGDTFINFVLKLRMEKARQLLQSTTDNLQTIAEDIGYANSGVFIRVFKKHFGFTPGQYRENQSALRR